MRLDEIKIKVRNYADCLIDDLFPQNEPFAKLKSATAKYWVKQNIWKLDGILCHFTCENGEIDVNDALNFYSDSLFDGDGKFTMSLRSITDNQTVSSMLPDKIVIFTRDDFNRMFGI